MGDIELAVDERTQRLIWKRLGTRSARQISEETGLPVDQVIRIRNEMLDAVDDLTIKQSKQKLIADLQDIATKTQEDYDDAPYEFKAGLMNSSIAAMKTILVELNRTDKADEEKVTHLNDMRIRELVSLIQEVVDISVDELVEKYDLEKDEVYAIFDANMQKAARVRDAISA